MDSDKQAPPTTVAPQPTASAAPQPVASKPPTAEAKATPRTDAQVLPSAKAEDVEIKIVDVPTKPEDIAAYLKNIPIVVSTGLTFEDRVLMAQNLSTVVFKSGQTIVKEGEEGNEFLIIKKGKAIVHRTDAETGKQVELGRLVTGDYFGETSLIQPARRGATITAWEGDVTCLSMHRQKFVELFGKTRVPFAKRAAVSAETYHDEKAAAEALEKSAAADSQPHLKVKTDSQRRMVQGAVRNNMLFKNMPPEQQDTIVEEMWQTFFKAGSVVIKQGDLGDRFFVVDSGDFDIFKDGKLVAQRGPGTSFGELALMYNAPRAATVVAKTDATLWVVDRKTYKYLMEDTIKKKLQRNEAFLQTVALFAPLTPSERSKIAEALDEANFPDKHVIVKQGDEGDTFFILKNGQAVCTQQATPTSEAKFIKKYVPGEFFGERALIKNAPRAATITTEGPCQVLYMNRLAFTQLLGPLEDILKQRADSYVLLQDEHKKKAAAETNAAPQIESKQLESHLDKTISLSDLTVIGTLGKGSFGHVQLVKDPKGVTHALKAVNKAQIVELGQQEHILSEKRTMAVLNHPFLVRLNATFKDQNYLYFLLEPALGGELFSVLRARTCFDDETARFYAAGVVLAFEYMHSKDIIYRDLKPENLLLDDLGYLKITDFGFAKLVKDRTWTLCGTPDYLAPEVVSGQGHAKGVDWWTLGILIYEMLASYPPFYDEDPMKTYGKIMHGQIAFPAYFSKAAIDLIKQLLHPKPTKRLGVIKGGASLVKAHPWFKGFDWDAFYHKKLPAPIKNNISSAEDLSNFEKYPDEPISTEPYAGDPKNPNWDADF